MREANSGSKHYNAKSVLQITPNGEIIKKWDYIVEAANFVDIQRGDIVKSCQRKVRKVRGFFWRYLDDPNPLEGVNDIKRIYKNTVACRKA